MTLEETAKIVDVIHVNYPDTARGFSDETLRAKIRLWHSCFERDPYPLVQAAVMAYIQSSEDRFMPNVGQIKEQIRKMTQPEEMSDSEAWGLVAAALRNGYYGYKEEYAKLPPAVQRAVGNELTLREWAQIDTETLNSVIASNFMRSYRAISKTEAEWAKLPAGFRDEMRRMAGGMFKPLELGEGGAAE